MNLWEWVTIEQAAERLQISPRLLRRLIDARRVEYETVDGVRLVWLADVVHEQKRQREKIAQLKYEIQRRGFAAQCRPGVPAER